MTRFLSVSVLSFGLALMSPAHAAAACSRQSPAHTVALLELYTSEGCSSCPPADRFVSALHDTGLNADQVVPLSLHVDYWDYIGWKDRFARHDFSERQRWLSDLAASRVVYTPEFFIGGMEQRNWHSGVASSVQRINGKPARARIGIELGHAAGGSLPVDVTVQAPGGSRLFVALYQNGLSTRVKAGENSGVELKHDYVVRDWIGPVELAGDGGAMLPRALRLPAGAQEKDLGVAAFVQTGQGEVLQALSLPLCGA